MTDDLRQRIDDAIRPTMLLGLQDAELFDAPGAERIGEWADWISNKVAELLQPELDQIRGRIHALHVYVPEADYCDVCSNHGDITWPCATIAALGGTTKTAKKEVCTECGHPKAQHQDADEPVSVGLCTACDAADSDDAWHNYGPGEEA